MLNRSMMIRSVGKSATRVLLALAVLSLAACGGGGGSSSSSSSSSSGSSGSSGTGASSFTVAGTISGLSNAGLQLQDYSGGQTLPVSAGSINYQFTQSVPSGTDVQVKVIAQPAFQTCTAGASNFSGPITANITTDTFSCTNVTTATVSLFAGSATAAAGNQNGTGTAATFNGPIGVAFDSAGNLYVADSANNEIRMITAAGVVTTLAGTGTAGYNNGSAATAEFNYPTGVAVSASGTIYVADYFNNRIREIECTGTTPSASTCTVSTLAGSGTQGDVNGTGVNASFDNPTAVAVDSAGNIYVADFNNNQIREVTPAGVVTTVAGSPTGATGDGNGSGTSASFNGPAGVAVDSAGNIYVADEFNNQIRVINSSDVVSTLAGSSTGTAGDVNGTGGAASFYKPNAVAVDSAGNVYVADSGNNEIRLIAPTGLVSTVAGTGTAGNTNGAAAQATFNSPSGIVVNGAGDVFVGDLANNEIRELEP